jgi:hypothetical protein
MDAEYGFKYGSIIELDGFRLTAIEIDQRALQVA